MEKRFSQSVQRCEDNSMDAVPRTVQGIACATMALRHGTPIEQASEIIRREEMEKLWKILRETKWDCQDKELESHEEKYILHYCISLMQELVGYFEKWYRWVHGENAVEELSEEERFCYNMSYFHIVQELFLFHTYHSGGTSTMAKCRQLGVDSSENIEFNFMEESDE